MQTLVFNTNTKSVKVTEGKSIGSEILYEYNNVPTVRVDPIGFYEVVQASEIEGVRVPVARFPISNTNMLIIK
jgi:hypothetical protein